MEEKGFSKGQFITIHRSFRVNAEKISRYNNATHEVEVDVYGISGRQEKHSLPVSENYRNEILKLRR